MNRWSQGVCIILSSPSGAGKTTICRELLLRDSNLALSVSATTRSPRQGEREGQDYFFLTPEAFSYWIHEGAFLEYAKVYGHSYGTPRAAVEAQISQGKNVLLDVDWQGAQAIRASKIDATVITIFVLPPSLKELERRLQFRGQDTPKVVQERMSQALSEMSHWREYDYILINDSLSETVDRVRHILSAEQSRRDHQHHLSDWIAGFERDLSG